MHAHKTKNDGRIVLSSPSLMLLFFRFFLTILASLFRRRVEPLGVSVVRFTVLPNDCDLNFHLNAGRFVSFMDVARVELLGRVRLLVPMVRRGWRPVIGGCVVRFRRSVLPFDRFEVHSRIVGWDEKWFYVEHVLERSGELCAVGHMRALIRSRSRSIPPAEVLALLHLTAMEAPPLPAFVQHWREAEDLR